MTNHCENCKEEPNSFFSNENQLTIDLVTRQITAPAFFASDESNDTSYNLASPEVIIEVATLQDEIVAIKSNTDVFNINLIGIPILYRDFRRIFYSGNLEFSPSLQVLRSDTILLNSVTNSNQKIVSSNLSDPKAGKKFSLLREMQGIYEDALGLNKNCWSSCSLNSFQKKLSSQQTLIDVGGGCRTQCSLTLDEFWDTMQDYGIDLSGSGVTSWPLDDLKVITAVITANFKSNTAGVPDVNVNWPYFLYFGPIYFGTNVANSNNKYGIDRMNQTYLTQVNTAQQPLYEIRTSLEAINTLKEIIYSSTPTQPDPLSSTQSGGPINIPSSIKFAIRLDHDVNDYYISVMIREDYILPNAHIKEIKIELNADIAKVVTSGDSQSLNFKDDFKIEVMPDFAGNYNITPGIVIAKTNKVSFGPNGPTLINLQSVGAVAGKDDLYPLFTPIIKIQGKTTVDGLIGSSVSLQIKTVELVDLENEPTQGSGVSTTVPNDKIHRSSGWYPI